MKESENASGHVVPPSRRWCQTEKLYSDRDPEVQAAMEMDPVFDKLNEVIDRLGAATDADDKKVLVRQLSDGLNEFGVDVSARAYDLGYGDGWTIGALAIMRMMAADQGHRVPVMSDKLAFVLGLRQQEIKTVAQ